MTAPRPALETAAMVRAGELSAVDVLEHHLAVIEAGEEAVHAFNLVTADQARAQARAVDATVAAGGDPGPLAGVPVALKDNLCTRGIPTTCSSRILEGWEPPYDATVVTRLAAAGAVAIGKTNMDEFAMGSSTETSAFGTTRNPHDTDRVPGGSSGGSAAAVAAGFAPLALGSDTGGSIRQPAALCGVVGMKPTYGTVSRYGLVAFASSLDQIGPFAGSVADAALLFDAIGGHDPLDSTSLNRPTPRVLTVLDDGVDGMTVGILTELLDGAAPDVAARVHQAAEALAAAGARVEEVSVPEVTLGLSAYYLIAPGEASSNLARYDGVRYGHRTEQPVSDIYDLFSKSRAEGFGPEVRLRIMLGTYTLSAGYYDAYYLKALKVRTLIKGDFDRAFEKYDVLLSPTSPTTAFQIGEKADDPLAMKLADICTIPVNLAGLPGMSIPCGFVEGLPVGMQIIGKPFGEAEMLRVAYAYEQATGWEKQRAEV